VQASGNELLIALLTNAQNTSATQLGTTVQAYDQRLATAEATHQAALQNVTMSYENRLKALETFFQSQVETSKQMAIAREQQLASQAESLREENKRLTERLDDARDSLMREIQRVAKTQDPMEQLGKMEGLFGTLTGIKDALGVGGGGGGGGDLGEGMDNPAFQMLGQLGDKLLNVVPNITDAIMATKGQGTTPPQRPALPPIQQRPPGPPRPPQQRPALPPPQQQGMPQQRPPQPPQGPPQAAVRVSKAELQKAIFFINNVLQRAPVPPPAELARGALGIVDNAVLMELAKRRPDKVIAELLGAGLLTGSSASPEGQQYVGELLGELRNLLVVQPAPVAQPEAQTSQVPEPEPEPA